MGLFKNLFKKKAGGTGIGNLFRGIAKVGQAVIGVDLGIGSGKNMIPLPADSTSPVADLHTSPVAEIKTDPVTGVTGVSAVVNDVKSIISGAADTLKNGLKVQPVGVSGKTIAMIIGGVLLVVLAWFGLKKKN